VTVEESRTKLYMMLEGVSLPEHEVMEAIITMIQAESSACRACATVVESLNYQNMQNAIVTRERNELKAIPVDSIKRVFRYCGFLGWGLPTAEADWEVVSKWLSGQRDAEVTE
jgi:hypothetical protein